MSDGSPSYSNPTAGAVTYVGGVGVWIVNVTTGITKPILGSAMDPALDLNSIDVSASGPASLVVGFSEDYFASPWSGTFAAEIGGTTVGSVEFATLMDPLNALFTGNTLTGLSTFGPGAFAGTDISGVVSSTGPFSLTELVKITHTGDDEQATSFNAGLKGSVRVPDGGTTLVLMGAAIMALGVARRLIG